MKKRSSTNKKVDKKIYKETAQKTKTINLSPRAMRGGIRL